MIFQVNNAVFNRKTAIKGMETEKTGKMVLRFCSRTVIFTLQSERCDARSRYRVSGIGERNPDAQYEVAVLRDLRTRRTGQT